MLEIDIDANEVLSALSDLSSRTDNLVPVLNEIGEYVDSEVALCFRDAKDPYGNDWEPLSDEAIARRENGGDKPLNDTGILRNSFAKSVSSDSLEFGTNIEYAPPHQFGIGVKQRPFLPTEEDGMPGDWSEEILSIIRDYLDE